MAVWCEGWECGCVVYRGAVLWWSPLSLHPSMEISNDQMTVWNPPPSLEKVRDCQLCTTTIVRRSLQLAVYLWACLQAHIHSNSACVVLHDIVQYMHTLVTFIIHAHRTYVLCAGSVFHSRADIPFLSSLLHPLSSLPSFLPPSVEAACRSPKCSRRSQPTLLHSSSPTTPTTSVWPAASVRGSNAAAVRWLWWCSRGRVWGGGAISRGSGPRSWVGADGRAVRAWP